MCYILVSSSILPKIICSRTVVLHIITDNGSISYRTEKGEVYTVWWEGAF